MRPTVTARLTREQVAASQAPRPNGKAVPPRRRGPVITDEMLASANRTAEPLRHPFESPDFPPKAKPPAADGIAMDEQIGSTFAWAAGEAMYSAYAEGVVFLGYSYLATLAQRPEYRVVSETIASEMTREWIEIKSASGEGGKEEKIKQLNDALDRLNVRDVFRKTAENDGFFGRGHIYIDTGDTDDRDELATDLGNGRNSTSKYKVGPDKKRVVAFRSIEPVWAYPTHYESSDPLKGDWYTPSQWYVMSKPVHRSRFLTLISREVPDILKPAYAFGGLSMSQMLKPYVDNWLKTRQAVADLIVSFSNNVLKTNMDATTGIGGDSLMKRVALFNKIRNNQGTMVLDKEAEDWANIATPLGTLDSLQAQSQEHMAAIARVPLVKLLGIQPAGLNASSEGELISFEDWIAGEQETLFRPPLTIVIDFVQLSEFGEVDNDIIFDFKPLRQMKEPERAGLEQTKATTRQTYYDMGAVDATEVRAAVAQDPESPFQGLDLSGPPPPPPGGMGEVDEFGNPIPPMPGEPMPYEPMPGEQGNLPPPQEDQPPLPFAAE